MVDDIHAGSNRTTLPTIATDNVGGVHYQRFKLDLGGDGLADPVVGAIPVSQPGLSGGLVHDAIAVGVTGRPDPRRARTPR